MGPRSLRTLVSELTRRSPGEALHGSVSSAHLPGSLRRPYSRAVSASQRDDLREPLIRSYLLIRGVIGGTGLLLPMILMGGGWVFLESSPRGSLSAYYHSGMRDVFVGILAMCGMFLVTYRVFETHEKENWLTLVAGIAAFLIALFPTARPDASTPLTPLQVAISEAWCERIHYTSAVVFMVLLGCISYWFGQDSRAQRDRERAIWRMAEREPRPGDLTSQPYPHFVCAGLIAASLAGVGIATVLDLFASYRILIGEWGALWGFGISWLYKGAEIKAWLSAAREWQRQVASAPAVRCSGTP